MPRYDGVILFPALMLQSQCRYPVHGHVASTPVKHVEGENSKRCNTHNLEPSVRKQHNAGYKHKANVRTYYQQFESQLHQIMVDQKIKEHLGQAAAYQPVGVPFNPLRPRLPVLSTPVMPIVGGAQLPLGPRLISGVRPPVLPQPLPGTPGYMSAPVLPPMAPPPGATLLGQANLPRPPTIGAPPAFSGSTVTSSSGGGPSMGAPVMYQGNLGVPTSGGLDSVNQNAVAPESDH